MRSRKRYVVNFPAHLADCEFNYRRLRRLMPGWPGGQDLSIDSLTLGQSWHYIVGKTINSEMAVSIQATERARYTTTVHIAVYSRLQKKDAWVKYYPGDELNPRSPFLRNRKGLVQSADKPLWWESRWSEKQLQGDSRLKIYSLEVRLYHDATVAEVVAWEGHRHFRPRHAYPNRNMYHCDEKAQLNRFLGELLEFCLADGRVMQDIVPA